MVSKLQRPRLVNLATQHSRLHANSSNVSANQTLNEVDFIGENFRVSKIHKDDMEIEIIFLY